MSSTSPRLRAVAAVLASGVALTGLTATAPAATATSAGARTAPASSPAAARDAQKPAAVSLATQPPAPTTSAAAATEPTVRLTGRGFGHGRGMSQWGARAAAAQGLTTAQILAFYYPGTTIGDVGNPDVRVKLLGSVSGASAPIESETGLTLTDGTCTESLDLPATLRWRATPTATGWTVERFWNKSLGNGFYTPLWEAYTGTCTFGATPALTFDAPDHTLSVTYGSPSALRGYRGALRVARDEDPSTVGASWHVLVNVLPMDQYLWSVVPAEMPGSWNRAAVAAQAVAARSYAAARLGSSGPFDICATTACQYYPGLTGSTPEYPNSTAAVNETSGQVLRYGGAIALAEFGSTNGGQTAQGTKPYQVSKPDPYDGYYPEAPDTWSYDVPFSEILAAAPNAGRFVSWSIAHNGQGSWFGGRVTTVAVTGAQGTQTVDAETMMSVIGLRSTYFTSVGSMVGTDALVNGFSDLLAKGRTGELWAYPGTTFDVAQRKLVGTFNGLEVLAPGDFDGDGIADYLERSAGGTLTLMKGTNEGTVASRRTVGTGWQNASQLMAPGDLDRDGAADLLARDKAGVLWLYPGNGTGGLRPRVKVSAGWEGLVELEPVGDLDGNGLPDLVGKKANGDLFQFKFTATGSYAGYRRISGGWTNASQLTGVGDVTGDGRADLLLKDSAGTLWTYPGTGTGGFSARRIVSKGWGSAILGS